MKIFIFFRVLVLLFVSFGCTTVLKRSISSETALEEILERCLLENGKVHKNCLSTTYKNRCENTEKIHCVKTFDEKIIPVSVVTPDEIKIIKGKISNFKAEFYNDIESGCHPRAFYIAGILAGLEAPIYVGQLRITGDFTYKDVGWGSHIAPFVYVKKNMKLQKLIIDPAVLSEKIEPLTEWLSVIKSDPNKLIARLFGSYLIFNYTIDPTDLLEEKELEKNKSYIVSHSFYELKPRYRASLISLLYLAASTIREDL